ncbi:hypothetical protein ACU18_10915 [Arthrobacter sp. ZBG10]|nr:hypothetical protein ACU18_10915 [Arthrobacter sp. ZBG10]
MLVVVFRAPGLDLVFGLLLLEFLVLGFLVLDVVLVLVFWFLVLGRVGCGVLLGPGGGPGGWFVVGVFGGVVAAGG